MTEFIDMTIEELAQVSRELGLEVQGSGSRGRILKHDYLDALEIAVPPPLSHTDRNIAPDIETVKIRVLNMGSQIWITSGPIENERFEPGQSYDVPADWWRVLRAFWTDEGEPIFSKENQR
jgi:hypothetical protein